MNIPVPRRSTLWRKLEKKNRKSISLKLNYSCLEQSVEIV